MTAQYFYYLFHRSPSMNARRIIAAAVTAAALLAVNIGIADSASAGTSWSFNGQDTTTTAKAHPTGTSWS
jgi:hypothetical protein